MINEFSDLNHKVGELQKPLKLGFIGGSLESAVGNTHRIAISMDEKFELVSGLFSRTHEKSIATARQYNISTSRAYSDIDEFIKNEKHEIDAVAIMTPQNQHFNYILRCLDSNIPVICEKALVEDVVSAILIKKKLEEKKGYLSVTYNYTGYPMIREMRHMISSGKYGVVQQIMLEMPQEGFGKKNSENQPIVPQEWRLRDAAIPTVSLDLGIHLHMMGYFLTGFEALEVCALSNTYGNFENIIDNVTALVKYENDITGYIWYGKTAMGYRNGLKVRILCSRGTLEWVQEYPEYIHVSDNRGNRYIIDRGSPDLTVAVQNRYQRFKVGHPAGFLEAFANYYYDVAVQLNSFINGKSLENEYVFGIDASVSGLKFLDALARSSKTNSWVSIDV